MEQQADSLESFGRFLRRQREMRDVSLDEIAQFTRIKKRSLEAIERDDFASLPPLAFVRAFVRCYADYIGLNVSDVMLRFDTFIQDKYPELTGEAPVITKKSKPRQIYIPLALGVLVVILLVFSYWISLSPQSSKKPGRSSAPVKKSEGASSQTLPPTSDLLGLGKENDTDRKKTEKNEKMTGLDYAAKSNKEGTSDYPKEGAGEAKEAQAGPEAYSSAISHVVKISVRDKCWVRFFIDRDKPREAMLRSDQTVTFEARESLKVKIGNPDAVVSVTHNDRGIEFHPRSSPCWIAFPSDPDLKACK